MSRTKNVLLIESKILENQESISGFLMYQAQKQDIKDSIQFLKENKIIYPKSKLSEMVTTTVATHYYSFSTFKMVLEFVCNTLCKIKEIGLEGSNVTFATTDNKKFLIYSVDVIKQQAYCYDCILQVRVWNREVTIKAKVQSNKLVEPKIVAMRGYVGRYSFETNYQKNAQRKCITNGTFKVSYNFVSKSILDELKLEQYIGALPKKKLLQKDIIYNIISRSGKGKENIKFDVKNDIYLLHYESVRGVEKFLRAKRKKVIPQDIVIHAGDNKFCYFKDSQARIYRAKKSTFIKKGIPVEIVYFDDPQAIVIQVFKSIE